MEELIKQSYGDNDEAKKESDEGKYDLSKSGTTILRQHWDLLIRPWSTITIQLHSQKTKDDNAAKVQDEEKQRTEKHVTVYETEATYRVDYIQKSRWEHQDNPVIYSPIDDDPIQLIPSSAQE
jgi:hypothetical protein